MQSLSNALFIRVNIIWQIFVFLTVSGHFESNLACECRGISGRRLSPPKNNVCENLKTALFCLNKQATVDDDPTGITHFNPTGITYFNPTGITHFNPTGITHFNQFKAVSLFLPFHRSFLPLFFPSRQRIY